MPVGGFFRGRGGRDISGKQGDSKVRNSGQQGFEGGTRGSTKIGRPLEEHISAEKYIQRKEEDRVWRERGDKH